MGYIIYITNNLRLGLFKITLTARQFDTLTRGHTSEI